MRIFVTGASGFIGSAVTEELVGAGHQVLGLARSDDAAARVAKAGGEIHRGELTDIASLVAGARACDGVAHLGFIHDFTQFARNAEIDLAAIEAMGEAMAGSGKPLVITSGTLVLALAAPGRPGLETDTPDAALPRMASEVATVALAGRGVRSGVIRLPPIVHEGGTGGFIEPLAATAREKGFSAYVGDGATRWPAAHRRDVARVYRLALEKGPAGARYHGVGEDGVPTRQIAEAIGRGVGLPVRPIPAADAAAHFGFIGMFIGADAPASSEWTRAQLGWEPTGLGVIADIEARDWAVAS
ncbi:MAG TPA: SDR family oxidoreductase [Caulobacteraceae bacterium]|jgi:nucleoside-diphosphate-sugar epimerase|nr:SDR family oxidoreductase [Caulobacteraceae bacterium]